MKEKKVGCLTGVIFIIIFIFIFKGVFGTTDNDKKESNENNVSSENITKDKSADIGKSEVPHREGMYGVSDKDIDNIESKINVQNVINDTTGNWRIVTLAENINIEEYALNYYSKYFEDNKEIHAIVNFSNKTTTKIAVLGDRLDVAIMQYVDKEEHDANLLFGGMLQKEYHVYLDNGDIEQIQ